jgi:hypothetical protein
LVIKFPPGHSSMARPRLENDIVATLFCHFIVAT